MKHIRSLLATAAVLLLGAALLSSCDKNNPLAPNKSNPTEYSLPGHDFTVMVEDYEHGFSKDSNYVFEGVFKDGEFRFGLDKLDPMTLNILPDNQNQLILKVSSETEGFQGVNASSSARCINIVPDGNDHTVYHLEWVAEGESTITLWCGEDATRKTITFKATSKKEIPLEGFAMRIGNRINEAWGYHATPSSKEDIAVYGGSGYDKKENNKKSTWDGILPEYSTNYDNLTPVEIVPVPLNATNTTWYLIYRGIDAYKKEKNVKPEQLVLNVYEFNMLHYPNFRWFPEQEKYWYPEEIRKKEQELRNEASEIDINTPQGLAKYLELQIKINDLEPNWQFEHYAIPVYPSDLRERRIIVTGCIFDSNHKFGFIQLRLYSANPYTENKIEHYHYLLNYGI